MLYLLIFLYCWLLGFVFYLNFNIVRLLTYFYFLSYFLICLFLLLLLNKSIAWYQIIYKFYTIDYLYISYIIGIDGISISFILLSVFIIIFCFLIYWDLNYLFNFYSFLLFFSLWVLVNIFASLDLFFFYIFFEGVVIPMFFLIVFGVVGSVKYMRLINFLYIHY